MTSTIQATSLRQRKIQLRRAMRTRREKATASFCRLASRQICRIIERQALVMHSQRIALYAAIHNEVNLELLTQRSKLRRKEFYYPKIGVGREVSMSFVSAVNDHWRLNRYGIAEPRGYKNVPVWTLDVVFIPLLAFDVQGVRLGTGAGYYDRAFAFRRAAQKLGRTILIGVGYEFQQVGEVPCERTDLQLDFVVTERGFNAIDS